MAHTVGLIGCGVISVTHLKGWRRTRAARVQGVFDINRSLAEQRAAEFGIDRVYDSVEELLESSDVVDVCTPPQTHAEIAKQVVAAGRHLIIEKPLVTLIEDWEMLSELINQSESKVAVMHNLKFVRSVRQAKKWVGEGRIGKVIAVSREFLVNQATDRMLDPRGHWSHGLPGGRWFETLPHELYLIHHFAGPLELSNVTAVATASSPPGVTADEVMITLKGNERLATVHYSGNCALNRRMLFVYGSTGMITVDLPSDAAYLSRITDSRLKRAAGRLFLEGIQKASKTIPDRVGYLHWRLAGETPHALFIEAFADYLEDEGPAPTPIDEIDYVVRNCERIGREIDEQYSVSNTTI